MVGFRNTAIQESQALSLPIVVAAIQHGLDDLERLATWSLQPEWERPSDGAERPVGDGESR